MSLKFKQFCKSLLAVVFATALILTSFSTVVPTALAGTADTGIVIAQTAKYTEGLQPLRNRMSELDGYIAAEDWNNVRAFIRGPLGELGPISRRLTDSLPAATRKSARRVAKGLSDHLNKLDAAAAKGNVTTVTKEYAAALSAFDAVLGLS